MENNELVNAEESFRVRDVLLILDTQVSPRAFYLV